MEPEGIEEIAQPQPLGQEQQQIELHVPQAPQEQSEQQREPNQEALVAQPNAGNNAKDDSDDIGRIVINRRQRNDSDSSDTSDLSSLTTLSSSDDSLASAEELLSGPKKIPLYVESSDEEIIPGALRPMYTFKPFSLTKCLLNSLCNVDAGFPLKQGDHHLVAHNSHLFALSSYYPSELTSREQKQLWRYSLATNRWQLELNARNDVDMASGLFVKSLMVSNNVLVAIAGAEYPNVGANVNECFLFKAGDGIAEPKVTLLEVTGDVPRTQYGAAFLLHQHYVYMVAGKWDVASHCDVHRFDLQKKEWKLLYNSQPFNDPEGRFSTKLICDGKHLFCLGGGGINHKVFDLQRILAFDLVTHTWDYVDTLPDYGMLMENQGYPSARKSFPCVQRQGANGDLEAIILGGQEAGFFTYISDIWKLNLRTKQWSLMIKARVPQPTYFQSAALVNNDCMYILGGVERKSLLYPIRNCTGLFKMWLSVPKLSELCWEAFTYYNDVGQSDRKALLSTGIPQKFVDRLPPRQPDEKDNDDVPSTSSKRARL